MEGCILLRSCLTQQLRACADYQLTLFETMCDFDCILMCFTQLYVTPRVLMIGRGYKNVALDAVSNDGGGGNDNGLTFDIHNRNGGKHLWLELVPGICEHHAHLQRKCSGINGVRNIVNDAGAYFVRIAIHADFYGLSAANGSDIA